MLDEDPLIPSTCDTVAAGPQLHVSLQGHLCQLLHRLEQKNVKGTETACLSPMGQYLTRMVLCAWVEVGAPAVWARLLCLRFGESPTTRGLRWDRLTLSPQGTACLGSQVPRGEAPGSLPPAQPSLVVTCEASSLQDTPVLRPQRDINTGPYAGNSAVHLILQRMTTPVSIKPRLSRKAQRQSAPWWVPTEPLTSPLAKALPHHSLGTFSKVSSTAQWGVTVNTSVRLD